MTNETKVDGYDLEVTRHIAAPPMLVWRAWTEPEHLRNWFVPPPVKLTHCVLDPRPGGVFDTTMLLPDGTEHASQGCILEALPGQRIAFTDAMSGGWRPADSPFMTAVVTMEPDGDGTRYTARVLHKSEADRVRHEEMGFFDGWGTCIDQLARLAEGLNGPGEGGG